MRRVSIPLEGEPTSRKNIARPFALSKQGVVMVSAKGIIAAISVFAAAMLATDGATSAGLERIHPGEAAKYRALYKCERAREKHGVNAPCEILAIGNKIVWEGKTVRSK